MADRMDSDHSSPIHGLSLWVGLAAFFSNSSERNKAHDAIKSVHVVKQAEKEHKAADKRNEKDAGVGKGAKKHGVRKTFRRFEETLGLRKKRAEERDSKMGLGMKDSEAVGGS